jgi:glycosyltransferase involved in cell wall biosynthesis
MKEKIIVITSYPPKDSLYGDKVGGLASFTKNTILSMKDDYEFIVLAEILDKKENYLEDKNLVKRMWKKNSYSLYFSILRELIRYRKESNKIFLEFEFSIYGSMFVTGFIPFLVLASKIMGYRTTTVIHQVVDNISDLSKHLGISANSFKTKLLNFLLRLYFKFLTLFSKQLIVLDQIHKNKLVEITKTKKDIHVIPHGVDQREVNRREIRKIRNIMVFGFVTWYKGTDWLVENFNEYCSKYPEKSKDLQLFVVGGESITQKENPEYVKYYNNVEDLVRKNSQVTLTGFIDEVEFDKYFNLADVVLLPYRVLMSSSGPLSLAFTYEKPFLISNNLEMYTLTTDFIESLKEHGLSKSDILFNLDESEVLFERIINAKQEEISKLSRLSSSIKYLRSWKSLGKIYSKVLSD